MTDSLCVSRAVECERPRFFLRRFRHRLWICDCGKAWRTCWVAAADSGVWTWERFGG